MRYVLTVEVRGYLVEAVSQGGARVPVGQAANKTAALQLLADLRRKERLAKSRSPKGTSAPKITRPAKHPTA